MTPKDWWIVGFGLRCLTLLAVELAAFLFVVPTLFDLHSDAADAGAALIALVALVGGLVSVTALSRELASLTSDKDP